MSTIFYEEKKSIQTSYTSFIRFQDILALDNSIIWICFANARWITYDLKNNKSIAQGILEANFDEVCNIIRKPRYFDQNQIVYINETCLKLHFLDVFNGQVDTTWKVSVPTLNALSQNDRLNREKTQESLDDMDLIVLEKTQTVIIMERKDHITNNSEYIITAFKRTSKSPYSIAPVLNSKMKKLYMIKLNEENSVCLYSDYMLPTIKFQIWNLDKLDQGWRNIEYEIPISSTIVFSGDWQSGKLILFGNPDQGQPQAYICQYEPFMKDNVKIYELENLRNKEAIIKEVIDWNPNRFIFEESGSEINNSITLYSTRKNSTSFYKDLKDSDDAYILSHDKKYFIGYTAKLIDDEDLNKSNVTNITYMSFINKRMWILHLLKHAKKSIQDKTYNLLEFYGNPFVAQHIVDMLC